MIIRPTTLALPPIFYNTKTSELAFLHFEVFKTKHRLDSQYLGECGRRRDLNKSGTVLGARNIKNFQVAFKFNRAQDLDVTKESKLKA